VDRLAARKRVLHAAPAIFATAGLVLPAAGCGGMAGSHVARLGTTAATRTGGGSSNTTDKFASALAYSSCMRSHGVPGYPDPKQVGDSIQFPGSRSGMNPDSRTFVTARESCGRLLPEGGEPSHADQQRALTRLLHISLCMRGHGVSGFPDPTLTPPSDRAGYSDLMSNGVAWLAIPGSIDLRSPLFQQAAATCKLGLS
jgi:hypothetical protein